MTDKLHRFSFDNAPVRGQWVRLETSLAQANATRAYPTAIRDLLAKMFAAVAMFADNLKFEGAVALQSRGNGALIRTLAECREQQFLRGIAHLAETSQPTPTTDDLAAWLRGADGRSGQLALSLIPANGEQTYQGLIELSAPTLEANIEAYFERSEQLPTRIVFAVTPAQVTGLLLQRLPSRDKALPGELELDHDAWETITTLAQTLTATELTDLAPQHLLHRLFNQYPCRLHPPRELTYKCSCSRIKSDRTLRIMEAAELQTILQEDGEILVDCEFCAQQYRYDALDIAQLQHENPPPPRDESVH